MALPIFTHVHCSSRYDRPPAALEADIDDWMKFAQLITMTEIGNDANARRLAEKGWNYYNAKKNSGADNCGISWDTSVWARVWVGNKRLHQDQYLTYQGHRPAQRIHACSALLRYRDTSQRVLVTVTHMPGWVQLGNHFNTGSQMARDRKKAYLESLRTWSDWCRALDRRFKPDGILLISDWNLDLKDHWVRDLLRNHWGKTYHLAWLHFPSSGGSMGGNKIIDGSYAKGLHIVPPGARLMDRVRSSDHRPYNERFQFKTAGEKARDRDDEDEKPSGDTKPGNPWWGFGDYADDELYEVIRAHGGTPGGEVL